MNKTWTGTPMKHGTAYNLYKALEAKYGKEKVRFVIEVCPVAVLKTIDNEKDAISTIENIEEAKK